MPDDLTIRPATHADLARLGQLKLRASLAWGDHVEQLQALPEARQVPPEHLPHVFVAERSGQGGQPLGFATVLPTEGSPDAELEDLFVDPAAWGQGVGRGLITEAKRRARALGAAGLHVIAGDRARPFYEAQGFHTVARIQTDFEPASEMRTDLG